MKCPYCGHWNPYPVPRCTRCNSDLPPPTCPSCGIVVGWGEGLCFRCRALLASEEPAGHRWDFHGRATPIVGRDRELGLLLDTFMDVAAGGSFAMVTVVGGRGLGKSRLAAQFVTKVGEGVERYTIARGRVQEDDRASYALFRSLLGDRLYIDRHAGMDEVEARLLEGIVSIVGEVEGRELAQLIGYLGGLEFDESPYLEGLRDNPARLTERAYAALVKLLEADAAKAPLALILDDVHLASRESLDLIEYLADNLEGAAILMVCLAEPSLLDSRPGWGGMGRRHEVIELSPLSDAEIEELFDSYFPEVDGMPRALVDLVASRAMGNPLTLEQVARILMEKGVIVASGRTWRVDMDRLDPAQIPGTLTDMVRLRLDALDERERRLLQMASVVGTTFWAGTLVALDRQESDHWPKDHLYWLSADPEEEVETLLGQLVRKDLIRLSRTSMVPNQQEYQFKHRVERDILYQQLRSRHRVAFHELVAQWLEIGIGKRSDKMLEVMAHHHEQGKSPERAARYYLAAADMARERYLNARAKELYQKALALMPEDDLLSRVQAYRNLGTVHALEGEHEEALCYFREMLRNAWLADHQRQGGVAYEKMGQVYRTLGEYDFAMKHFHLALGLFERAGDTRGIAAVLDDIGRVHWIRGELDPALENHRESLRLRRELGDEQSIALALGHIGSVLIAKGDLPGAMEHLRESLELRRKVGDLRGEAESLNAFGAIFFERGYFDRAIKLWEEAIEICRQTGDKEIHSYLLNNIGEALLELDRPGEAEERLLAALDLCRDTGSVRTKAAVLRNLGRVALAQGHGDEAMARAEEALELSRAAGLKVTEGLALCLLGQIEGQTLFDSDGEPSTRGEEHFREAIELLEMVGDSAELGRCLERYATFLRERSRDREADSVMSKAGEITSRFRGESR